MFGQDEVMILEGKKRKKQSVFSNRIIIVSSYAKYSLTQNRII